jgi:hypothetical protein
MAGQWRNVSYPKFQRRRRSDGGAARARSLLRGFFLVFLFSGRLFAHTKKIVKVVKTKETSKSRN